MHVCICDFMHSCACMCVCLCVSACLLHCACVQTGHMPSLAAPSTLMAAHPLLSAHVLTLPQLSLRFCCSIPPSRPCNFRTSHPLNLLSLCFCCYAPPSASTAKPNPLLLLLCTATDAVGPALLLPLQLTLIFSQPQLLLPRPLCVHGAGRARAASWRPRWQASPPFQSTAGSST